MSENLGIGPQATELPDVQQHAGTSGAFDRALLLDGHQRRSPGDGGTLTDDRVLAAKVADGLADPPHAPVTAADFARPAGQPVPGSAPTGAYADSNVRRPVSPNEALFGQAGDRYGYGQPIPVSMDQLDNNADGAPQRTDPSIDTSPSIGADTAPALTKAHELLARGDLVGGWNALLQSIEAESKEDSA